MPGFEETYFLELKPGQLNDTTRTDLTSTRERWMEDVRRELRKVEATTVGKMLLDSIRHHQRWVQIGPLYPFVGDTHCNPLSIVQVINYGGRRYGSWLGFSPEKFAAGTACAQKRKDEGNVVNDLHEAFFHELVHSFRHVSYVIKDTTTDDQRILLQKRLTGGLRWHTNREEFIAVLVTNIYASANGKRVLRADHHGHRPMEDDLEGSFKFFQIGRAAFTLVDEFCKVNKGFTTMLSKVKAPFNPIRAYVRDPEKARRLSQGKMAAMRDWVGDNPMGVLQNMMPLLGP